MIATIRRVLPVLAILVALQLSAGGPLAAVPPVSTVAISDTAFKPAVDVVTLGTKVVWHNTGTQVHTTTGSFWSSPNLKPGGTFSVVFNKLGQFPYHDAHWPLQSGTIVVLAGGALGAPPSTPSTGVSYHYQGTASLTVKESWTYYDPVYQAKRGPCNVEVGGGARSVAWTAHFPTLLYARYPNVEGLSSTSAVPAKLAVYHESQHAMVSPGEAGNTPTDCGDGTTSTFAPPTEDASCTNDMAGWPLTMQLGWSRVTGKFILSGDDAYSPQVTHCGELSYAGVLVLVGVDTLALPLGLTGYHILYDEAQTTAYPNEIALLRRGQPLQVTRRLTLNFTTPCCDGFAPHVAVLARIGAIWHVDATLTLQLQPK